MRLRLGLQAFFEIGEADGEAARAEEGLAQNVFELTDVAGPRLFFEMLESLGLDLGPLDLQGLAVTAEEILDEERDVLAAIAQGRQHEADDG